MIKLGKKFLIIIGILTLNLGTPLTAIPTINPGLTTLGAAAIQRNISNENTYNQTEEVVELYDTKTKKVKIFKITYFNNTKEVTLLEERDMTEEEIHQRKVIETVIYFLFGLLILTVIVGFIVCCCFCIKD